MAALFLENLCTAGSWVFCMAEPCSPLSVYLGGGLH